MTQNTGSLGQASGSIVVDVSQLRQAGQVVQQVAAQMTKAFASVNAQLAQMGQINPTVAKMVTNAINAQAQATQNVAQATAQQTKAAQQAAQAVNQQAAAMKNAAQAAQQQATAQQQVNKTAQPATTGGGGLGQRPTVPAFIQFGLFPFAGIAQSFGASGLASGLMGAGSVLGAVDAINPLLEGLSRVAGRFRDVGGILGALATTAVTANGTLAGAAAALGTIALVAAPFVLAIGGIALVIQELQRRFEEAKQAAENYIGAQTKLADLIAGGATSADIQERTEEVTSRRDARQNVIDSVEELLAEFRQFEQGSQLFGTGAMTEASRTRFDEIRGTLQSTFGSTDEAAIRAAIEPYKEEIESLNAELAAGISPANQAMLALNDQRAAFAENAAAVAENMQAQLEYSRQIRSMTAQQGRDRLDAIQIELTELSDLYTQNFNELTEKERAVFDLRIEHLYAEMGIIEQALPQLALKSLLDTAKKFSDMVREFDAETTRIQADRNRADDREFEDFIRNRVRAQDDFNRARAEAEADFYASRAEAQEKFLKERQEAENDFNDRLAKLIRDARISILEAASRLDARGVFEQQRRLRQQIADMTDEQKKQREQREKAFEEQLADQQRAYDQQRQAQLNEFMLRMNREAEDRRIRLAREDYDRQIADMRRQEDFNNRVNQLIQQNAVIANIVTVGGNTIAFIWSSIMNGLVAQTQAAATPLPGGGLFPLATGLDRVPYDGLAARLHIDETVLSAPPARALRRALGSNFSMSAATRYIENGGGSRAGGAVNVTVENIVFGDIGERSDDDVIRLMGEGFKQFFGGALARSAG